MGSSTSGAKSSPNHGSYSGTAIPILMNFSTPAFEGTAPADRVGLGEDEVGVAGIPRPPTTMDTRGTLPATSEAKMSKPSTPLAKA